METKRFMSLALLALAAGAVSLSGCSSSEVQDESSLPADDLPVVDANTDALPNSLEGGADQLSPEASVEVPDGQDAQAAALTEEIASTDPSMEGMVEQPLAEAPAEVPPEVGPSMDAPPSMNEMAPPMASTPTSDPGVAGAYTYEIQAGDTLMKIAYKVYGDLYQWRKIHEANRDRISDPSQLVAGTQLQVEHQAQEDDFTGFERYLIKDGDTLGSISSDVYGTKSKWKRLWQENDRLIKDPNRIYAGFVMRYSFTEQDRMEKERGQELKQDPQPLAGTMEEPVRDPSAANAPTEAMPSTAAAGTADVVPQN